MNLTILQHHKNVCVTLFVIDTRVFKDFFDGFLGVFHHSLLYANKIRGWRVEFLVNEVILRGFLYNPVH